MKNLFRLVVTISLVLTMTSLSNAQKMQPEETDIKGEELWEKTIAYHDPHGKWDSYKGIMHMVTVIGKNRVVEEVIEINKPENYYKCTRIDGDLKAIKGFKNGKYFYAINEDTDPSEELAKKYGLTEENTSGFKVHHTCHFGLPMELKTSGVTVEDKVVVVEYDGRKCYALTFNGMSDLVSHDYYEGELVLYIDTVTFAMRGIKREPTEYPKYYIILSGEIEVNSIKIPHIQAGFRGEDDTHWWSSIFTTIKN